MATLDGHVAKESVKHGTLTGTNAADDRDDLAGADIEARHGELEAMAIMTIVLQNGVVHLDAHGLLGEDGVGLAVKGVGGVRLGVKKELLNALQRSLGLCREEARGECPVHSY